MENTNVSFQVSPGIKLFSADQKAALHNATLELLRRTGVKVLLPETRDLLKKAGCWVDGEVVRIPPHLIDWAIDAAPSRIMLCDREGYPALELEENKGYYGTGSDTPYIIDAYSGERREAQLADITNSAKIVDALPHIDFLMCMGIASDVTKSISDLYHFRGMVSNTTKPIVFTAWNLRNLQMIVSMAEEVAGGAENLQRNPFCVLYAEPISPLVHAKESCEKLQFMAAKRLPVIYTAGVMIGGTAPVTLAGALVQGNAEALSGLLITQLVNEGAPVVLSSGILFLDMQKGLASYAAPEFMLGMTAVSEMYNYYKIPSFTLAGCTDAKLVDQQAAAEGSIWMLISALGSGNLIHDVGFIDSGLTSSYQQLVIMDEVAALVKRFIAGIEINQDTLALDVIDQVGHGGQYLSHKHTLNHFRKNWVPALMDRATWEDWAARDRLSMADRAARKIEEILETHEPVPLDNGKAQILENMIDSMEKCIEL